MLLEGVNWDESSAVFLPSNPLFLPSPLSLGAFTLKLRCLYHWGRLLSVSFHLAVYSWWYRKQEAVWGVLIQILILILRLLMLMWWLFFTFHSPVDFLVSQNVFFLPAWCLVLLGSIGHAAPGRKIKSRMFFLINLFFLTCQTSC